MDKLGAKFAHACSAVGGLADTQSAHALMRNRSVPRKLVGPIADGAGLLDALNAPLPPTIEPPVRRQHCCSSRVTPRGGHRAGCPRAVRHSGRARLENGRRPPSGGPGALPHRCPLFHATQIAPGGALATSVLRGQAVRPMRRAGGRLRRPRRVVSEVEIPG